MNTVSYLRLGLRQLQILEMHQRRLWRSCPGCPAPGQGVANTGHQQKLLGHRCPDSGSVSGGRDEAKQHRATVASHFARNSMVFPQQPWLSATMESLARMVNPWIVMATILEQHLTLRLTWPLQSLMVTDASDQVFCLLKVCFYMWHSLQNLRKSQWQGEERSPLGT